MMKGLALAHDADPTHGAESELSSPVPDDAPELLDDDEVLLRHIRTQWYDNGVASSQNFEPLPKDRSHLSTERGALILPEAAHDRWIAWGRDSAAVFGVQVGQFRELNAPSYHVPDTTPGEENPEHALVKYPSVRSQAKKMASKVKKVAVKTYEP